MYNFILTGNTMYLSKFYIRRIASLLAFNIYDPDIISMTNHSDNITNKISKGNLTYPHIIEIDCKSNDNNLTTTESNMYL